MVRDKHRSVERRFTPFVLVGTEPLLGQKRQCKDVRVEQRKTKPQVMLFGGARRGLSRLEYTDCGQASFPQELL